MLLWLDSQNIKEIFKEKTDLKGFSQYADDTEIMLEGDKNSSEETVKTLITFGNKSGLFFNTREEQCYMAWE